MLSTQSYHSLVSLEALAVVIAGRVPVLLGVNAVSLLGGGLAEVSDGSKGRGDNNVLDASMVSNLSP
jgi:hypothetical protein